jgi:hypothetical protein
MANAVRCSNGDEFGRIAALSRVLLSKLDNNLPVENKEGITPQPVKAAELCPQLLRLGA